MLWIGLSIVKDYVQAARPPGTRPGSPSGSPRQAVCRPLRLTWRHAAPRLPVNDRRTPPIITKESAAPATTSAGASSPAPPCRPRLLLVDDEPNVLDGLRRRLRAYAIDIGIAASAVEAQALMERQRYQILITDHNTKPCDDADLRATIAQALAQYDLACRGEPGGGAPDTRAVRALNRSSRGRDGLIDLTRPRRSRCASASGWTSPPPCAPSCARIPT